MPLHMMKLSVGVESIEHLAESQYRRLMEASNKGGEGRLWHRTRYAPKRTEELLEGGSIYWVIRGAILVRQKLIGFEKGVDNESRRCCRILLDPKLMPTVRRRQRAFQGWRYLPADAAPKDRAGAVAIGSGGAGDAENSGDNLPPELAEELRDLGLL